MTVKCVFCHPDREVRVAETEHFYAVLDKYPVNPGHVLIVSRKHIQDLFALTPAEFSDLRKAVATVREYIDEHHRPAAYNVGANCGEAAGQTIPHFHLHVIPRYENDIENPRGGVRNIKKPMRAY